LDISSLLLNAKLLRYRHYNCTPYYTYLISHLPPLQGHNHAVNVIKIVGRPTPSPTPIAILSLMDRLEELLPLAFSEELPFSEGPPLPSVAPEVGDGLPPVIDTDVFRVVT